MGQQYKVNSRSKLLPYLFEHLEGWSKKTIKQRLQNSTITVNGLTTTQHDFMLNVNDIVAVGIIQRTGHAKPRINSLEILYQDKDLIAINKPSGLLSVGTTKETKQHALALLRLQLSRANKNATKLWPVHRLDRDTSGILLFATSKEVREGVMDTWSKSEKIYLAIVEGKPKVEKDTITQPLRLDEKKYRMHVGVHPDAKSAITHYQYKEGTEVRSLLEVRIETGRQHQIRAHMAYIGCAVVGDERYGTKGGRLGLHAMHLTFTHPVSKKDITLEVDAPRDFYILLK